MLTNFNGLCYKDAYMKSCEAKLIRTFMTKRNGRSERAAVLDRSCFFPEGGGQPGDKGTLRLAENYSDQSSGVFKVKDTYAEGDEIIHVLEGLEAPPVNAKLIAEIDWQRRYDFMQQHSSEHIFSGIVKRDYGFNNVGFNINEKDMSFDYDGYIDSRGIEKIASEVNEIIYRALPYKCEVLEAKEAGGRTYRSKKALPEKVRLVTVEGIDCCACCGTQLRSTAEIGLFMVTSAEKYKRGVRIRALSGMRAVNFASNLLKTVKKLSVQLSSPAENLPAALERIIKEKNDICSQKNKFSAAFFKNLISEEKNYIQKLEEKAKTISRPKELKSGFVYYNFLESISSDDAEAFAKLVSAEEYPVRLIFLSEKHNSQDYATCISESFEGEKREISAFKFFILSPDDEKSGKSILKLLKEKFSAKGGGRDGFFRGFLRAGKKELITELDLKGFYNLPDINLPS